MTGKHLKGFLAVGVRIHIGISDLYLMDMPAGSTNPVCLKESFMFEFANGEETNSATPLGPMDDYRDVRIDSKLKSRKMEVGDTMTFIYDYSSDWSRKVKLVEIL